jgi:hypothetical protein
MTNNELSDDIKILKELFQKNNIPFEKLQVYNRTNFPMPELIPSYWEFSEEKDYLNYLKLYAFHIPWALFLHYQEHIVYNRR